MLINIDKKIILTKPTSAAMKTHRGDVNIHSRSSSSSMVLATLYGWLLNFILLVAVLGITAFQLMCLTDLEFDYINPYDSASRINMLVLPEYMGRRHLVDVTEIYNQLSKEKKQRIYKLGYLVAMDDRRSTGVIHH